MTNLMQQPPPTEQRPSSRRNKIVLVVTIVVAIVAGLSGLSLAGIKMLGPIFTNSFGHPAATDAPSASATPAPATEFTVTGTLSVPASDYLYGADAGDLCYTDGGYEDIGAGKQIEVQNGSGETIALGTLSGGVMADDYGSRCEFYLTVTDIPEGEAIYSFRAGNSVRGGMKYTRDELKSDHDTVALSLG